MIVLILHILLAVFVASSFLAVIWVFVEGSKIPVLKEYVDLQDKLFGSLGDWLICFSSVIFPVFFMYRCFRPR